MVLEPQVRAGRAGLCVFEAGSLCMNKPACLSIYHDHELRCNSYLIVCADECLLLGLRFLSRCWPRFEAGGPVYLPAH